MTGSHTGPVFWPWLFSTAEARTSNSLSSPKPDVDPPPSKTAGGAVQQAEDLLVIVRAASVCAWVGGWECVVGI